MAMNSENLLNDGSVLLIHSGHCTGFQLTHPAGWSVAGKGLFIAVTLAGVKGHKYLAVIFKQMSFVGCIHCSLTGVCPSNC